MSSVAFGAPETRPRRLASFALSALILFTFTAFSSSARSQIMLARPQSIPVHPPFRAAAAVQAQQVLRPIEQIVVKFRQPTDPVRFAETFSAAVAAQRGGDARALPAPALTYRDSLRAIGWHIYKLGALDQLHETLAALNAMPAVLHAIPDGHSKLLGTIPNPPNGGWQTTADQYIFPVALQDYLGLPDPQRQYDSAAWNLSWQLETVQAQQAWNVYPGRYPTAADRVSQYASDPTRQPLVAVIDTGLDLNHFGYANVGNSSTDAASGGQIQKSLAHSFSRDNNPSAMDVFGHGTSAAGIVGAAPNVNAGVPGLGFPGRIVPIRPYGADGDGNDTDLVRSIIYAVNVGCTLINISARTDSNSSTPLVQDAVNYAWNHGSLIIAASGNDGSYTSPADGTVRRYPASCDHALSVGATGYAGPDTYDPFEELAFYSNYGDSLGVVAPAGQQPGEGDVNSSAYFALFTTFYNYAPQQDQMYDFLELVNIPDGFVPEFVFAYSTAPTYYVPLSDPNDPNYGGNASLHLYGLNYGTIAGTSFAAPLVSGLATLYASKNGITQTTPNGPERVLQAIERGADNIGDVPGGDFSQTFGWGRINAYATITDTDQRSATKGGIIGMATDGYTAKGGVVVTAKNTITNVRYQKATEADGVFHIYSLPAGDYKVTALGYTGTTFTVHVTPGCDTHGADFHKNEIHIQVVPQIVNVPYGGTYQFSANVTGSNDTAYTWTIPPDENGNPENGGATLSSSGLLTAPLHPAAKNYTLVEADADVDGSVYDTGIVHYGPVTVQIVPHTVMIHSGETRQLKANVGGTLNKSVTWSVVSGGGTITSGGLYTPPNVSHTTVVTIRATSVTDPSVSATSTITVMILDRNFPPQKGITLLTKHKGVQG